MNQVVLLGRLVRDPELNYQAGTGKAYCRFTVAVDEYNPSTSKREAQFFDCVCFDKKAESLATYMTKGRLIAILGKLKKSKYVDKAGVTRYDTSIFVLDQEFLGSTQQNQTQNNTQHSNQNNPSRDAFSELGFGSTEAPFPDGDLPF